MRATRFDGSLFLGQIRRLPESTQKKLIRLAAEGDHTTPTCPSCGVKMVGRTNSKDSSKFWGCRRYPRCKHTFRGRDRHAAGNHR
ncbi:MAG: topoisomerase DNA-binding C4 zinc finger domain-containing protein [Opitutaceae bacterium]